MKARDLIPIGIVLGAIGYVFYQVIAERKRESMKEKARKYIEETGGAYVYYVDESGYEHTQYITDENQIDEIEAEGNTVEYVEPAATTPPPPHPPVPETYVMY